MKYIKPKSVTWWSGLLLAVLLPALKYMGIEVPDNAAEILTGAGLIGLRQAIK